jgi:hypothetical protein
MIGAGAEAHVVEQLAAAAAALVPAGSRLGLRQFDVFGSRKKRWKTNPMCSSRRRLRARSFMTDTSRPSKSSRPDDGVSTQPSMWSSVDLPQPDGPLMAT